MKYLMAGCLLLVFGFLLADFVFCQKASPVRESGFIPFFHELHGDSLGLSCATCHTGAHSMQNAFMPSKKDCMDCHRLPLTENPGIEKLDSLLSSADEYPWKHKSQLPEHVVFHHGVHAKAFVACKDCHNVSGKANYEANQYGGEMFSMKKCVDCHQGNTFKDRQFKPAAVHCAACHR